MKIAHVKIDKPNEIPYRIEKCLSAEFGRESKKGIEAMDYYWQQLKPENK